MALLGTRRIGLALIFAASFAGCAAAQELEQQRQQSLQELSEIEAAINLSESRRGQLSAEIDALENDRKTMNTALIAASARARELENRIDRSSRRLEELRGQEADLGASLRESRGVLSQVLGTLMRMGRDPPPALLVSPDDALASVRSAILLGAVVPEIRAQAHILAVELEEMRRIAGEIEQQRASLRDDLRNLAEEDKRLSLLLAEKKRLTHDARRQMAGQSARAAELAAKAGTLGKLIDSLEGEIASAQQAAQAAIKAEEERRAAEASTVAAAREEALSPDFSDAGRIAPAIEFEAARGLLPRPVSCVEIRSFGQENGRGDAAQGISIATRADARVLSPADGWVVYAGPFRSYGQLLILNAGSGYYLVMAGMERIEVDIGHFVLTGEPVASMGAKRIASADALDIESSRPVLYVEFRKDGTSVDPSPWWSDAGNKRDPHDS